MNPVYYLNDKQLAQALHDEAEEQVANIDGGDECKGSDTRISALADLLDAACQRIRVLTASQRRIPNERSGHLDIAKATGETHGR